MDTKKKELLEFAKWYDNTSSFLWHFSPLQLVNRYLKTKNKQRIMSSEKLAGWLHDNYEEIAKSKNWNTQVSCKVKFEDLPKENKETMLELAKRIINRFKL